MFFQLARIRPSNTSRSSLTAIVCFLVAWAVLISNCVSAQEAPARHSKAHDEILATFQDDVEELIKFCQDNNLPDGTKVLEPWSLPVNSGALEGVPLPKKVIPEIALDLAPVDRKWQVQLKQKRHDVASQLYLLSRRMLNDGYATAAWQVLREVTHFDPDHKQTRLILGFEQYGDEWVTPYSAKMLKAGNVWTEKFGWLRKEHVARYVDGERYVRGRWVTAERENVMRQNFMNAWEIETDNYLVKTNVSHEKAVELAMALEEFHSYFRRTFAAFFDSPEQLKMLFDGRGRRTAATRFEIHFFRTRDEFIAALKKDNPRIAITNGIYMPDAKIAYFFDNPETETLATLYHEATHQILYELYPNRRLIGETEHFWIIEGIACYMESFERLPNGYTVGSPQYIRFRGAEYRLNESSYYVPLAQLSNMGKLAFQSSEKISENYTQASGLSHFFMHYENGKYRDALIKHLSLLYVPRSAPVRVAGLDQLTGVASETLDRQYREYITALYAEK